MKNGQTPIHIMRWAPADYVNDPFVRRCYQKRDFRTVSFYSAFLFYSFMEGGDLPSDLDDLAAIVLMPARDVEMALAVCKAAGKIQEEDGRLFHQRVRREVDKEFEFRRHQAELGRKGAKARVEKEAQGKPKGTPSPPSPSPSPAPIKDPPLTPPLNAGGDLQVEPGERDEPVRPDERPPDHGTHDWDRADEREYVEALVASAKEHGRPAFRNDRRHFRDWYRAGVPLVQAMEHIEERARDGLPLTEARRL